MNKTVTLASDSDRNYAILKIDRQADIEHFAV